MMMMMIRRNNCWYCCTVVCRRQYVTKITTTTTTTASATTTPYSNIKKNHYYNDAINRHPRQQQQQGLRRYLQTKVQPPQQHQRQSILLYRYCSSSSSTSSSSIRNNGNDDDDNNNNSTTATTSPTVEAAVLEYDIVIVGGGVIGSGMAHYLHQLQIQQHANSSNINNNNKLRIAIIESSSGPTKQQQHQQQSTTTTMKDDDDDSIIPHPRSYALSPASLQVLFGSKMLLNNNNNNDETTNNHSNNGNKSRNDDTNNNHNNNNIIDLFYSTNIQKYFGNTFCQAGYYTNMQIWESQQPASLLLSTNDLLSSSSSVRNEYPEESQSMKSSIIPSKILGWCIEDSKIQEYLWYEQLQYNPTKIMESNNNNNNNITIYPNTVISKIQRPNSTASQDWVYGTLEETTSSDNKQLSVTALSTVDHKLNLKKQQRTFRTRLLIAADGSQSTVRQLSGIEMEKFNYHQTAITFTVQLSTNTNVTKNIPNNNNNTCAYQRYLSNGNIIALLPTYHPNYATIVWSTSNEIAQYWKQSISSNNRIHDDGGMDLVSYLNEQLQTGPQLLPPLFYNSESNSNNNGSITSNVLYGIEQVIGTIQYSMTMAAQQQSQHTTTGTTTNTFRVPPMIEKVVSKPYTYPLYCQIPKNHKYTKGTHLALIGDAAHTIHPMAGQGLNLGIQDIVALSQCIMKAKNSGMDIGTFLHEYNTSRQIQVSKTIASIHGLQQLLCHQQGSFAKHIKSFGMNCIQNITPLRQQIVRAACYGI